MSGGVLSGEGFVRGGFVREGFCPGRVCPGGVFQGVFCPGGFCPGGFLSYHLFYVKLHSTGKPRNLNILKNILLNGVPGGNLMRDINRRTRVVRRSILKF